MLSMLEPIFFIFGHNLTIMSINLMMTIPDRWHNRVRLFKLIEDWDIHKWIVGYETGKGGYKHLQVRLNVSKGKEEAFLGIKEVLSEAHIEECSDTWEYERKSGCFVSSEDTAEIRRVRFGTPNRLQKMFLKLLESQGIRQIDVIFDASGNHGKSWFVNWMYETGRAFYCPPTIDTVKGMIQWIASGYRNEGVILIDIPRTWKWSEQLYIAIESIKDGLVYDTRYTSKLRNIRGVKVMCMTNEMPKLDKLSADRWRIVTLPKTVEMIPSY